MGLKLDDSLGYTEHPGYDGTCLSVQYFPVINLKVIKVGARQGLENSTEKNQDLASRSFSRSH